MTASASKPLLWFTLVLILILALSAMVALTEYTLRTLHPGKALMFDSDPVTIARFKKNLDRTSYGSKSVHVTTNSFSFRDSENFDPAKADIIIFGDSNIASLSLEFKDTIGEQLEEALGNHYVAANLGVPGYGPDQSLRKYLAIADQSKAKAIVFHIFADNDLGDLFRNNIYYMSDSGILERRSPLDNDPLFQVNQLLLTRGINKLMVTAGLPFTLLDVVSDTDYYSPYHQGLNVPILSDDDNAIEDWARISITEFEQYKKGRYTSWTADHYDYGIAGFPAGDMATAARELLAGIIRQALSAFPGPSECMLVLIEPSENDISEQGASVTHNSLVEHFPEYNPRTLTDISTQAAEAAGASYINLFDAFSRDPGRYYFSHEEKPGDNHWNARGIAMATQLVAEHFSRHRCL